MLWRFFSVSVDLAVLPSNCFRGWVYVCCWFLHVLKPIGFPLVFLQFLSGFFWGGGHVYPSLSELPLVLMGNDSIRIYCTTDGLASTPTRPSFLSLPVLWFSFLPPPFWLFLPPIFKPISVGWYKNGWTQPLPYLFILLLKITPFILPTKEGTF